MKIKLEQNHEKVGHIVLCVRLLYMLEEHTFFLNDLFKFRTTMYPHGRQGTHTDVKIPTRTSMYPHGRHGTHTDVKVPTRTSKPTFSVAIVYHFVKPMLYSLDPNPSNLFIRLECIVQNRSL